MFAKDILNKKYDEYPEAALIDKPGNAEEYKTGSWRTEIPVFNREKCTDCMLCWIYCPDLSIFVKDKKVTGIDYEHCKGCGICAKECPVAAITMEDETQQHTEVSCKTSGAENA